METKNAGEIGAIEVHGMTRSAFILRSTLAASSVYGLAAVGPFVGQAIAQSGGGDVDIVSYAYTLELLEADFYKQAQKLDLGSDAKKLAKLLGDEEQEHVDALKATIEQLGGTAPETPTFTFPLEDEKSFVKLAIVLEDTGVSAYNGAAPMIESTEVLGAAGGIVQIEARHAAAMRVMGGEDPAPDAFDKSLEMAAVLDAIKPFIKA